MLLTNQHPHNKSIMVSLLGMPNAGKSTLVNHLLGFDLSIVSKKPQTTRNSFHCCFNVDRTEIVLVDSPGVHKSSQEMNIRMNGEAQKASEGVDKNLILIDSKKENLIQEFDQFVSYLGKSLSDSWVIFNKSDVSQGKDFQKIYDEINAKHPFVKKYFVISAKEGENVQHLVQALCDNAESGPHYYHKGDVSNKNMRFFVTEYIREQAFRLLKEELPYELAVTIDKFIEADVSEDNPNTVLAEIHATILVNRPSQRAIVVGSKGSMIKEIGTRARKKIEAMMGGKVFLKLHVKIAPKWFRNNFVLEELGLPRVQKSRRVWRKK